MSFNAFYGLIRISVLVINDNYTKKIFFLLSIKYPVLFSIIKIK